MLLSGQIQFAERSSAEETPVIRHIKNRPVIVAILAAAFTVMPSAFLAQTAEMPEVEKADTRPVSDESATAPAPDVAVDIEKLGRQLNEFRSEYLDHRADSITWGLATVTVLFAILGLVVAIIGFVGFKNLRSIEADAHKRAAEAGKHAAEASKHVEETKAHKTQAEKDALATRALRKMTSEDAANPAKAKQVEKAVETVRQAHDASPIDKAIAMAYSLQKADETQKAIEKWRSIAHSMEGVDNQVAARAWFSVGYLLFLSQNWTKAISAYDQAIRLDQSSSAAYNNRGSAKNSLGQHEEAIKDFDEAIRLDPNNAAAYINRGNAKSRLKQYDAAINDHNQAIRLDPNNANAYSNRGSAKIGLEQDEEAIKDFDEAIRLVPSDAAAYNNRGNAKDNLGQHEEAIKDYDQAIRLDPSNAVTYSNRGNAKILLEQYEEAIKDCDEAIRLAPDNSFAYCNRGRAKVGLKRIEVARSDFQTALRLAQEQSNENLVTAITDTLRQIDNPGTK